MARKTITTVELTDDLDGGKADQTLTFMFDGTTYEIDLSKKNANAMVKAFKPYVDAARKVKGSRRRVPASSGGSGRSARRTDLAEVRTWAQENGYTVSDRGRVAAEVLEAYDNR